MVLAEAEAGWKNWEGAVAALSVAGSDTAGVPSRLWYMLGVALQESGDDQGAAVALARFVESVPRESSTGLAARSRLARALATTGAGGEAVDATGELHALSPLVGDWTALKVARILAPRGEAEAVGEVLALVADPSIRRAGWRLEVDAWAASGDTARALESLAALDRTRGAPPTRVDLLATEWPLRLALGDSVGAVVAMEELLRLTTRGRVATDAAMAHWEVAVDSGPEILRLVAAAMGSGGRVRPRGPGVEAGGAEGGGPFRAGANGTGPRLQRKRRPERGGRGVQGAVRFQRSRDRGAVPAGLGRHSHPSRPVRRRPHPPEPAGGALPVTAGGAGRGLFPGRRSSGRRSSRRGDLTLPRASCRCPPPRTEPASPECAGPRSTWLEAKWKPRGGCSGRYLDEFPGGRRWEEASYWGARAAVMAGDTSEARALLARLRRESPLSYYTFLTDAQEGSSFSPDLAESGPLPDLEWLPGELEVLALLEEAGLVDGAAAQVAAMRSAAGDSEAVGPASRSGVARGGSYPGRHPHRPGGAAPGAGLGPHARARVVYPFPYRELVTARAEELGLDPFLLAGIIRQESAFVPAIVSAAGAIGLMQVMPATGERARRPDRAKGFPHRDAGDAGVERAPRNPLSRRHDQSVRRRHPPGPVGLQRGSHPRQPVEVVAGGR